MKKLMLVGLACVFALGLTTGCSESDDAKVARLSEQAKVYGTLSPEDQEKFRKEVLTLPADKRDQVTYEIRKQFYKPRTREEIRKSLMRTSNNE